MFDIRKINADKSITTYRILFKGSELDRINSIERFFSIKLKVSPDIAISLRYNYQPN